MVLVGVFFIGDLPPKVFVNSKWTGCGGDKKKWTGILINRTSARRLCQRSYQIQTNSRSNGSGKSTTTMVSVRLYPIAIVLKKKKFSFHGFSFSSFICRVFNNKLKR